MQGHNTMAAAVQYANLVSTVSPTYAEQIKTVEYGEKIEGLISFLGPKMRGITNGIDTDLYDPSQDKYLEQTYSAASIEKRAPNKSALQKELGLPVNPDAMLMGIVSRLVDQKGIGLILQILDRFMAYTDAQLVVLGTGDADLETQLWQAASRYRGRMSVQLLYSDAIARRIYSGCDVFLMPSKFEPCGISQLLAMRYGCVPIVRRTGGLVDTVSHHDPVNNVGTGYCFDRYEPLDLYTSMVRAWEGFRYKEKWQELQQRGMSQDVSWLRSALDYLKMYKEVKGQSTDLTTEEIAIIKSLTSV